MLSRDQSLRSDTWNLFGTSGNVFDSSRAVNDSSSTLCQGMLHSLNQTSTGGNPLQDIVQETCRQKWRTISRDYSNAESCKEIINLEFLVSRSSISTELRDRSTKTSDLGVSIWQIPTPSKFFTFGDKVQNPSKCLFQFSPQSNVMDRRSGDGWFIGRIKIIALNSRLYSFPEFRVAGREDCACSEQDHPEIPLQEKGQSGGTESSERRSVHPRKTDRLHDLRLLRVTDAHDTA